MTMDNSVTEFVVIDRKTVFILQCITYMPTSAMEKAGHWVYFSGTLCYFAGQIMSISEY